MAEPTQPDDRAQGSRTQGGSTQPDEHTRSGDSARSGGPSRLPEPATPPTRSPEEAQRIAERSAQLLYDRDQASQMLGMRLVEMRPGYARVVMRIRSDMVNGHKICHGGLVFTLSDSAFAFSCNSYNENTVAAAGSIDFLAPAYEGDELTAVANELWRTRRSGLYEITVTNQRGERIALFRGRSSRIKGEILGAE